MPFKKILLLCFFIPATAMASFGAAGNKIDYLAQDIVLGFSGQGSVAVATLDARPYVVSGDKGPDFVGQIRGGFGNPFQVKTGSGHALADDIDASVAAALTKAGFSATTDSPAKSETAAQVVERLAKASPDRILVVQINGWKTDSYMHTNLHYDVTISVYDRAGTLLDHTDQVVDQGVEVKSSFSLKPLLAAIATTYREKLTGWLNDEKIRVALGGTPPAPANATAP